MPAIVGKQRETMAKSSGPYQKVKVTDEISSGSQTPSFSGEYPADLFIQRQDTHPAQELLQRPLIPLWVAGVEHALVELGQRHNAQPQAIRGQILKTCNNLPDLVQMVDCPIRIDQILQVIYSSGISRDPVSRAS